MEENHRTCKRSRAANGNSTTNLGQRENHQEEEDDDGEAKGEVNNARMRIWHHPSSRIFRVSRASGGKDRHSKVYTSKGLRDRRVRLSVSTAIQFYDLQDRLGYDQPSKAIEWLIKAASSAIDELPSLDATFPEPLNMEKPMPSDSGVDPEAEPSYNQQQHSSTSETSKGSVLSLSRSESRMKARERAKERVKDKEEAHVVTHHQSLDVSLHSEGSFTKLLTGGSCNNSGQAAAAVNFIQKQVLSLPPVTSTADYFSSQSGLFAQQQHQKTSHSMLPAFSTQPHFSISSPIGIMAPFSNAGGGSDHQAAELQPLAFLQDNFFPVAAAAAAVNGGDYNLNFSISPSLTGFHRGTLQSNSPSHLHHHQLSHHHHHQAQAHRLAAASMEGSSVPFFFGAPATSAAAASHAENRFSAGFDGHLQLGDGYKHLELKGKGKSL